MGHEMEETTAPAHEPVTPLLDTINSPEDLRTLEEEQLPQLAAEIRERIIHIASTEGGHLAPHLGVVDLTLAVHYAFDTPRDHLIWDVGHQCYAHKFITGRRDQMRTIRKRGGLSGYPRRSESEYDDFGTGHSSTSISAALGMAVADAQKKRDQRSVAIIGDGAMTAGMAFEALSHAGYLESNVVVILNDNRMSIAPNVGALSTYFSKLITNGLYNRAKHDIKRIVPEMLHPAARKVEHQVKGFLTPFTMFEELGFKYVGPIDGHCIHTLVVCLENIRKIEGPVFLHVVTQKGKGYEHAERDPLTYHGVRPFEKTTGQFGGGGSTEPPVPSFTDAFAEVLLEATELDERVVSVTAAMPTGTGVSKVAERFPDRVFDVGICEQHAVTFSAGLAAEGMKPVCAIYSTFLQRGFDQVLHDVCLQNLPVLFAIDRAGCVGEDSPTQQGAFDLSFLRCIPNIQIMAPRDAADLKAMTRHCLTLEGPTAIRYARGKAPSIGDTTGRDISCGEILRHGDDATLLGLGPVLQNCLEAAERLERIAGLSVAVADARWVKPLDEELIERLAGKPIITIEENSIVGGFGSAVLEHFEKRDMLGRVRLKRLGFPDEFVPHGTREEQLADIGLDVDGIVESVRKFLGQEITQTV